MCSSKLCMISVILKGCTSVLVLSQIWLWKNLFRLTKKEGKKCCFSSKFCRKTRFLCRNVQNVSWFQERGLILVQNRYLDILWKSLLVVNYDQIKNFSKNCFEKVTLWGWGQQFRKVRSKIKEKHYLISDVFFFSSLAQDVRSSTTFHYILWHPSKPTSIYFSVFSSFRYFCQRFCLLYYN